MDRLWVGYWMGGITMAIVVLLSHINVTPSWRYYGANARTHLWLLARYLGNLVT